MENGHGIQRDGKFGAIPKDKMTDASDSWPEVRQALVENRYELVLSGADVSKRISDSSLDMSLFFLQNINFLEISKTVLSILPDHVGNLSNLTRLVVHSNQLSSLPGTIDKLTKLKNLDVSRNQLETLPQALSSLAQLQVLNVSNNKLESLPELNGMPNLVTVDASVNCLQSFPFDCTTDLTHLTEIRAKANKIGSIPYAISNLSALKLLDLEDNVLNEVPGELGDCGKLKDCNLKGNPLKDRRLRKLVDQCHTKQVLDYVRVHCGRDVGEGKEEEKGGKTKKKSKGKKKGNNDVDKLEDMMNVMHVSDCTPHITITEAARDIRPHIVCCILKDIDLETGNNFKKFIALQTKLHENECERRNAATIATHDLTKISGNLTYDAQPPPDFKITPLMRQKEMTAEELFSQLRQEAEALRKEKKRNTFSGIHKYLYLLEGKTLYPCLVDDGGQVISFPPITNSDGTKISASTKDIFVEVTSSANIVVCKKVMETLLLETLRMGLGKSASKSEESLPSDDIPDGEIGSPNSLTVEQVKVIDKLGQLRSVYPSRTDLQLNGVKVIRSFEN